MTKTLLRGLGGDNRGLGGRWGAARGLAGIVGRDGGNKAVREWVGAGLKTLGELMEREDEIEAGERAETVREILVSLYPFSFFSISTFKPDCCSGCLIVGPREVAPQVGRL